jgi:hypothetical protein
MGNSVPTSGQFKLRFTRERPESSAPTAERDVMAKALNVEATMLGALTRKYSPDPRSNSRYAQHDHYETPYRQQERGRRAE